MILKKTNTLALYPPKNEHIYYKNLIYKNFLATIKNKYKIAKNKE